jgi:hypothetical protein
MPPLADLCPAGIEVASVAPPPAPRWRVAVRTVASEPRGRAEMSMQA